MSSLVEITNRLLAIAEEWQVEAFAEMPAERRIPVLQLRAARPDCIAVRLVLDVDVGDVRAYLQRSDTAESTPIAGCSREANLEPPVPVIN